MITNISLSISTADILRVQAMHYAINESFDAQIGHALYWHALEGDPLPGDWHEQVAALVRAMREHADEIERSAGLSKEGSV